MAYDKQQWTNGSAGGTPINAARLDHIETGIDDAHTELESLTSSVSGNIAAIGQLDTDLTALQGEVATAQGDITALEGGVSNLESEVASLTSDVQDIQSRMHTKGTWDYTPFTWAHRGGASVVPEESYEGYQYAFDQGFPLEGDVQFLADGTPVLCHDSTVDRTMLNIGTGAVSTKTQEEWRKATIKPAVPGGKPGSPMFFEEWLDRFGGRIPLIPEVKNGVSQTEWDLVIGMVKARGLTESVILQSFDFAAASYFAAQGMRSLFLFGKTLPTDVTPADIAAAGIEFAGPNRNGLDAQLVTDLKAVGLKVVGYTVKTPVEHDEAINTLGLDGVFSDDPAWTSGQVRTSTNFQHSGFLPPGVRRVRQDTASDVGHLQLFPNDGIGVVYDQSEGGNSNSTNHITCPWAGKLTLPVRIDAVAHALNDDARDSNTLGITLLNRPIEEFVDNASPGQEGFTIGFRGRGDMDAWEYVEGQAAAALINQDHTATPAPEPFFPQGGIGTFRFQVLITETDVTVWWDRNGFTPRTATAPHNVNPAQDFYLGLRIGGQPGWFTDINVLPL